MFEKLINILPKEIIDNLKKTDQSPKYHKEGNVYIHTKMVFEECQKYNDIDLMISAIFHDLGKIDTHKVIVDKNGNEKITHHKHEILSLDYIDKYFHLYEKYTTNKEKIKEIVKNHMRMHLYNSGEMKKFSKRQSLESNKYFNDISKFTKCDDKGRIT